MRRMRSISATFDPQQFDSTDLLYRLGPKRSAADTKTLADSLHATLKATPELGDVEIVTGALPRAVREDMAKRGIDPARLRGVFHEGRVYVNAATVANLRDGIRVALHEAVGHKGLRGVLGTKLDTTLMMLYRSLPNTPEGRAVLRFVRHEYKFLDESKRADRLTIAEEAIAHLLETSQRPKAWQRVVSKLRELLRACSQALPGRIADVLALGEQSRTWLKRRAAGQETTTAPSGFDAGLASTMRGDNQAKGIPLAEARRIADAFMAAYNGNIPLTLHVVNRKEEAYGPQGTRERIGVIKGAYHLATGRLVLAAANLRDARDATDTLAHEVLGHYGLNTFTPSQKRKFLDAVLAMEGQVSSLSPAWRYVKKVYGDMLRDVQIACFF
nr:hypothetical protein [uncultured Halomonas sp.]